MSEESREEPIEDVKYSYDKIDHLTDYLKKTSTSDFISKPVKLEKEQSEHSMTCENSPVILTPIIDIHEETDVEFTLPEFTLNDCRLNLCREKKTIYDSIHQTIKLSDFAVKIIDTKIFQRLRYLKQLGTCDRVFQNGVHTRFEHSLGTYHLAKKILFNMMYRPTTYMSDKSIQFHKIYLTNIPEISQYVIENNLYFPDDYIIELISIAALCHDLGHGPFSHVFDDIFLAKTKYKNHENANHENRSCLLLTKIIKENEILHKFIPDSHIKFMCDLIHPKKGQYGYIYQIVSNKMNNIDVDKFDYICRDSTTLKINISFNFSRLIDSAKIINLNICYSDKNLFDILNLFQTRYYLHKQIYCNKGVVSSQLIICKLMKLLDSILNISGSILNMDDFMDIDDTYILNAHKFIDKSHENYNKIIDLIQMLNKHRFYAHVFSITSIDDIFIDLDNEILKDYINDIIIYKNKIGFVSGSHENNPLDNIYIYKTSDLHEYDKLIGYKCDKDSITKLLPKIYQENIFMIFYKNKDEKKKINCLQTILKAIL